MIEHVKVVRDREGNRYKVDRDMDSLCELVRIVCDDVRFDVLYFDVVNPGGGQRHMEACLARAMVRIRHLFNVIVRPYEM